LGRGGKAFISCGMLFLTLNSLAGDIGFGASMGVLDRSMKLNSCDDFRLAVMPKGAGSVACSLS
jgi:hypothetical protein